MLSSRSAACASAVTEALAAAGEPENMESGETRGESLLLPLLQGLLGGAGDKLLAGLGAAPADVVADVRRSLARLRAALAPPTAHPQARALLTLADRLEDALDAADRLDGCRRKPKRRTRAARYTVGVTQEELEEARRLVDREQLDLGPERMEPLSSSGAASTASTAAGTESTTPERKPSLEEVSYHDAVAARRKQTPTTSSNTYEAPKITSDAITIERRAPAPRRPHFFRHSVAHTSRMESTPNTERRPSDNSTSIANIANKFDSQAQISKESSRPAPRNMSPPAPRQHSREEPKRTTLYVPPPPTYNFAAPPSTLDDSSKPAGRFNSNKKLRMKRANTIDIGRPLGGYRVDSDTDEEGQRRPAVPEFTPQTENDRKFVAFMKKNEQTDREPVAQSNWSSRFGNIKNAFESRERDVGVRSSSASSARSFWKTNEVNAPALRPRKFFAEPNPAVIKPPWVTECRESVRTHFSKPVPTSTTIPVAPPIQSYAPSDPTSPYHSAAVAPKKVHSYSLAPTVVPPVRNQFSTSTGPPTPSAQPPVPQLPQTPTKPFVVKPFVTRPIPVNQFSHAPMSAFKPPAKVASPTRNPTHVWSPPSTGAAPSPASEDPSFPFAYNIGSTAPPAFPPALPLYPPVSDQTVFIATPLSSHMVPVHRDNDRQPLPRLPPATYETPIQPTRTALPSDERTMRSIPSQSELSAPQLVRRADDAHLSDTKPDTQRLQIEFYERQIRERNRREPEPRQAELKPPTYTVTDYTPPGGITAFVPLQRTPDIEKTRAHKVDYLPDVVTNDTDCLRPNPSPRHPPSPRSPNSVPSPRALHNGDPPRTNGYHDDVATEHGSVVTRVMRGPVRGSATITAGVRTRGDDARGPAAESLKGALDKLSSPKRDVLAQIERRRRESALEVSRESVGSSSSAASIGSAPLSRSGSWQAVTAAAAAGSKPASPRRVVARAKSMHLLAVPKLYEGGIAREQVVEKKRTVEAYFSGRAESGARARGARTREPPAAYSLGRSRTMPAVTELQFLDESNADDAFEDLVSGLA